MIAMKIFFAKSLTLNTRVKIMLPLYNENYLGDNVSRFTLSEFKIVKIDGVRQGFNMYRKIVALVVLTMAASFSFSDELSQDILDFIDDRADESAVLTHTL